MKLEVYHTTKKGNGEKIKNEGWRIYRDSPHLAFYGRGIYFWELEQDAHLMGEYWYDGNYDIVAQEFTINEDLICLDRAESSPDNADSISKYYLDKNVKFLKIKRAYFSHRRKLISNGSSIVYLVDLELSDFKLVSL